MGGNSSTPALSQQSLPRLGWEYLLLSPQLASVVKWIPLGGRVYMLRLKLFGRSLLLIQAIVITSSEKSLFELSVLNMLTFNRPITANLSGYIHSHAVILTNGYCYNLFSTCSGQFKMSSKPLMRKDLSKIRVTRAGGGNRVNCSQKFSKPCYCDHRAAKQGETESCCS